MFRRFTAFLLIVAMTLTTGITVFAAEPETNCISDVSYTYTVEDVKALEPYVHVSDGCFILDVDQATADGIDQELLDFQQSAFDTLNGNASQGTISINNDLSITSNTAMGIARAASHAYNCGGGQNTSVENYWWGYARYMCDCESNRFSADLNSAASVAAGIAVIATFINPIGALVGLDSAYWWLVASRVDANNKGHGIYIEMTYVLAFNITPQ